jgi:hypothetical protein
MSATSQEEILQLIIQDLTLILLFYMVAPRAAGFCRDRDKEGIRRPEVRDK